MNNARTTTTKLVIAAAGLAMTDYHAGIPLRHATNTGASLARRVEENGVAVHFKGDDTYLRSVYTAAYWWESMQDNRDERQNH